MRRDRFGKNGLFVVADGNLRFGPFVGDLIGDHWNLDRQGKEVGAARL